jgi:lysophospholipase L1-like esterase
VHPAYRFLAVILLALPSCHNRLTGMVVQPDDPAIRYEGRWDCSDPTHPRASWPAFALETGFTGSAIAVRMDDAENYYQVEIDGQPRGVVCGRKGGRAVVLAEGLPAGKHRLRLARRNISFERPTRLDGFIIDRGERLLPVPHPARVKIEFIGDSYTVAEGNEATAPTLPWKKKYPVTNTGQGFAAMIGRAFDADFVTVCRSGSGVLCDYLGNRAAPMTELYDWTLMEQKAPSWDFSQWTPDVVVVALGLNDFSGLKRPDGSVSEADTAAFRKAYRLLLQKVRAHHPRAEIVAVAPFYPWLREQIREIVREDGRLHYAQFDEFPGGYVADGHPTVETHRKMAAQLVPQLAGIGGLRLSSPDRENTFSRPGSAPRTSAN